MITHGNPNSSIAIVESYPSTSLHRLLSRESVGDGSKRYRYLAKVGSATLSKIIFAATSTTKDC
jgi:hypothetical protein